ncbi:MAG: membrane protein insertion efficiency factor YidD [bacterium]|nr:membrane protein insertion efficiency factor YidD [bacterium]MDZ4344135.1 membrane protein insertion efficiency factor YidD [Candidatus Binatia bacterium]
MSSPFSPRLVCLAIKIIRLYQRTLSPDHGPLRLLFPSGVCRFQPTCSQYTIEALEAYGWRGLWLGAKRITRCNPFTVPGNDPVVVKSKYGKASEYGNYHNSIH